MRGAPAPLDFDSLRKDGGFARGDRVALFGNMIRDSTVDDAHPSAALRLMALLDWHVAVGVDLAMDDAPHDRFAESAAPAVALARAPNETGADKSFVRSAPEAGARRAAPVLSPDAAAQAAQEAAAGARDLDELAKRLADFGPAPFRDMARHFLFASGAPGARAMVFDIAPGAAEESSGEAFCGRPARLLDNMLKAIALDRASAYLAYYSPWRPPGDKALTPHETAILAPFARRHVELARPELVLIFGEAPARALLETSAPRLKLRGKSFDIGCGGHVARALAFSSIDAILRSAPLKPAAWRGLRVAAEMLR